MKTYQSFLSENFQFLEVKFSIYLNRRVFVMTDIFPLILLCFSLVMALSLRDHIKSPPRVNSFIATGDNNRLLQAA